MEFNEARVYTAVNAYKLKAGSLVVVADDFCTLKRLVHSDATSRLASIANENVEHRFVTASSLGFSLAYLVEEPKEQALEWTSLRLGDTIKSAKADVEFIVTGMDRSVSTTLHVFVRDMWLSDKELADWVKVEARPQDKGGCA